MRRIAYFIVLALVTISVAFADVGADYNQSKTPWALLEVLDGAKKNGGYIEALQKYQGILKAESGMGLANKAREKSLADLRQAEEAFQSGEGSSFDVLKAKSAVLEQEQRLQEATKAWVLASAELSRFRKETPDKLFDPEEENPLSISSKVDLENFEEVLNLARKKQRGVSRYLLEHAVVSAHVDWRFKQAYLDRALEKQALSETYLRQSRVSLESGFASQNDVLAAELLVAQAQYEVIVATGEVALARFRLLEATGMLDETINQWLKTQKQK